MDNDPDIKEELTPEVEAIPDEDNAVSGASDPATKIKKLKETLARSEKERLEYLDGWQRAKADLVNYKKDEGRRLTDMAQFLGSEFVSDFLPALDSFDLALRHEMPKEVEKGIIMIRSQLEDTLKRRGLEVIHSLHQVFDPSLHEAIGEVESDKPEGTVIEELQKGYKVNGKVIRPARVKIAKK